MLQRVLNTCSKKTNTLINSFQRGFNTTQNKRYTTKLDLAELNSLDLPLVDYFREEIMAKGPITFEHYMDRSLCHEQHGYYMKKDVFNTKGDFITSPEISQMFGEMIGIWCINFLEKLKRIDLSGTQIARANHPKKRFSLLEFGPGRGTLMSDIVRTLQQFNLLNGVEINFIEYSPFMRKLQQETMTKLLQKHNIWMKYEYDESKKSKVEKFTCENPNMFFSMRWFSMYEQYLFEDFKDLAFREFKPKEENLDPVIIIAHEFFDALPVHIFEYSQQYGWCEKLVNICHDISKGKKFEFILSDPNTENVNKILKPSETFKDEALRSLKTGDTIEVCKRGLALMNSLSELIAKTDGAALIFDYGENHALSDSIRGIRNHKYIEQDKILDYPGEIDLSAYVNFAALSHVSRKTPGIHTYGAIPQGLFLESMGLATRLEMLCQKASPETLKRLESEYNRLVSPHEMGEIYKVLYVTREENSNL